MATKWNFNQQFIEEVIRSGRMQLIDFRIPKNRREKIKDDLKFFKSIQQGNIDGYETSLGFESKSTQSTLPLLKEQIIGTMKIQYIMLGENMINWTIMLAEESPFTIKFPDIPSNNDQKDKKIPLSIDEQIEFTLKNYKEKSQILYEYATEIIKNKKGSLIQEVENLENSSFCHYTEIVNLPFIVVKASDGSSVVNHEIEHGIESMIGFRPNSIYEELGPIYQEFLFSDYVEKQTSKPLIDVHVKKIKNTDNHLSTIARYFKVMKKFAVSNFDVTSTDFINAFATSFDKPQDEALSFIKEEIAPDCLTEDMCYLYSFLKSVEIYCQKKDEGLSLLLPHLETSELRWEIPKQSEKLYSNYVNDVYQKIKKQSS